VGGNAGDKRAGELRHPLGIEEQIDRALAIEVAALKQETSPKFSRQVRARNSHFFQIADWLSGEHSGLRHVRSDERGAGEQSAPIQFDRLGCKRTSPLVATITGSITSGIPAAAPSAICATSSTISAEKSKPVLIAPTGKFVRQSSICSRTFRASTGSIRETFPALPRPRR
jgi:hypothetical protein